MNLQSNHFAMKLAYSRIHDLHREAFIASLSRQHSLGFVPRWAMNFIQFFRPQPQPACYPA